MYTSMSFISSMEISRNFAASFGYPQFCAHFACTKYWLTARISVAISPFSASTTGSAMCAPIPAALRADLVQHLVLQHLVDEALDHRTARPALHSRPARVADVVGGAGSRGDGSRIVVSLTGPQ